MLSAFIYTYLWFRHKNNSLWHVQTTCFASGYLLLGSSVAIGTSLHNCRFSVCSLNAVCTNRLISFHVSIFMSIVTFMLNISLQQLALATLSRNDKQTSLLTVGRRQLRDVFGRCIFSGMAAVAACNQFLWLNQILDSPLTPTEACLLVQFITLVVFLYYTAEYYIPEGEKDQTFLVE